MGQKEVHTDPIQISLNGQKHVSLLKNTCKWLSHLSGAIGFTWSFWCAILTGLLIGSNLIVLLNIDGYRPTTLVVESIYFMQTHQSGSSTAWGGHGVDGIVDGNREKFGLGDYVPDVVNSREEIEKHIHIGQSLAVMYNPNVYKPMLRVLYPEKNFIEKRKKRIEKMINTAYVPYAVCMLLCFLFGFFGNVLKSCIALSAASLGIIFLSWLPTLIDLVSMA